MENTNEEKCFTAEKLYENSHKYRMIDFWKSHREKFGYDPTMHRHPDTIQGFLTKEKVAEMFVEPDYDQLLFATGLCFISNGEVFFLTDDCLYGHGLLPKDFIPCSISGLHYSFGEGQMHVTVDDILSHYGYGEIHLNSVQELVDYLNREFGE